MPIELPRDERQQAIASLERYFEHTQGERIGNVAAGALLAFFLEDIAPLVYNRAIADAQARMQQQVQDLDIALHEEPFARSTRPARGR